MIKARIEKLRYSLEHKNLDGIFVVRKTNMRYLSGFKDADSFVFIATKPLPGQPERGNAFITDSRYLEDAVEQCTEYTVIEYRPPLSDPLEVVIGDLCARYQVKRLAFEREHMSYGMFETIRNYLPQVELCPESGLVESLREIKDRSEIADLRQACSLTDKVFEKTCTFIRPGITEKDIERQMLLEMTALGTSESFASIIISGPKTSRPHGKASYDKIVQKGEFVLLDFGCTYNGYCADMTRTVMVGAPSDRQKEVYELALAATLAAQQAVRDGVTGQTLCDAAQAVLSGTGYERYTGGSVGHGVGLNIHENPFMRYGSEVPIRTNQVITIEPGIYIPGDIGVRVEDTILVKETGGESLFVSPKHMICL